LSEGIVKREEVMVVGKVFNHHHHIEGEDRVKAACEASVAALGVGAIDLYLMHWPFAFADSTLPKEGLRLPNSHPRPEIKISEEYLATWAEMIKLKEAGLVKAIGVSNFTVQQLENITKSSGLAPVVNQVEFHPYLFQKDLVEYCAGANIRIMAYSPLGAGAPAMGHSLLEHPVVLALAEQHGKSAGQILIRWSVQLGNVCIPKSVTEARIAQNLDVFSWELAEDDMKQIASLDAGHRFTRGFMEGQWFEQGELSKL
jgi:diketogulonate reductase-like aldo/keto reductase